MRKEMMGIPMFSVAAAVILAMSGCGGGGGGGSAVSNTSAKGRAVDGYISGAIVCYDMNINGQCDRGEPTYRYTDENGSYELNITADYIRNAKPHAPILLVGQPSAPKAKDTATGTAFYGSLKAPFTAGSGSTSVSVNVTPLTTIAAILLQKKKAKSPQDAYTKVAKALGLKPNEVSVDPIAYAKKAPKVLATTITLQTVVHKILQNTSDGKKLNIVYDALSDAVAEAITNESNGSVTEPVTEIVKVAVKKDPTLFSKINLNELKDIEQNVTTTIDNAIKNGETDPGKLANIEEEIHDNIIDPVAGKIKNLFKSYGLNIDKDEIAKIENQGNFSSVLDVDVEKILALGIEDANFVKLKKAYTVAVILSYIRKYDPESEKRVAEEIAAVPGITYQTIKSMKPEEFANMIKEYGETHNIPELISLAFTINPPEYIRLQPDIAKAKNLFESVRTNVYDAQSFVEQEGTQIDNALEEVSNTVEFTTKAFSVLNDLVVTAIDNNESNVSRTVANGKRKISVDKAIIDNDVLWSYSIIDDNNESKSWQGQLEYPNIDDNTFDPNNFTVLNAKLSGKLPIGYYGQPLPQGKVNSQKIEANFEIDRTNLGANFHLDANINNNGDAIGIKDANVSLTYDVNDTTKKIIPKFVEVHNLYVNAKVGNYSLDGKLDVKSYAVNKLDESKGFEGESIYYWIVPSLKCTGDNSMDMNSITFKYNGKTYRSDFLDRNQNNDDIYITAGFDDISGDRQAILSAANDPQNYGGIPSGWSCSVDGIDSGYWTEDDFTNSGHYPSEIEFNGTLDNEASGAYLNARIDAKWSNIENADLYQDSYKPFLNIGISGRLKMPESETMILSLFYANDKNLQHVSVGYIAGDVAIKASSDLPYKDGQQPTNINLSSSAGIFATIKLDNDGKIDTQKSSLTNKDGKVIGYFEDRKGVPVVKYIDGSFESLF